jgi:hypothetical protein
VRPIQIRFTVAISLGWLVAQGCSKDATGPAADPCTAEIGSVTATVTAGTSVKFDWTPRCAVAMVLVEEDASDQWIVATPEDSWTSAEAANKILPPLTYGETPAGTDVGEPPATLVAGREYDLILWRVLPSGSTAQCQQRFENMCLLTVTAFTR